jgi:hypothetical protein
MKNIFFSFLLLVSAAASAQSFEGVIEFTKMTSIDTSHYKYFVKGNNVRIDEIGSKGKVTGVMLVDLAAKKVTALNIDRKLYMDVDNKPAQITGKPEINKKGGSKKVAGVDCKIWTVSNPTEKTEMTYAVAPGKYDFFVPMLKTLNRKDKAAMYFLQIPDNASGFPAEAIEKSGNEIKTSLVTSKIEKKTVDASIFQVPKDFQKYQK